MLEPDLQALEVELAEVEEKYKDILKELNLKLRQEIRKVGIRKNVVPTKYVLPKAYIDRLLEYRPFRIAWYRKPIWIYLKEEDKNTGEWLKIIPYPNIGGVPVEEGPELRVEVVKIPRRKRRPKNA